MFIQKLWFVCTFLYLFNASLLSADLFIIPQKITATIPAGAIEVTYLDVVNNTGSRTDVHCVFDSTWIFMTPKSFSVAGQESKKILAVFFISRGEDPNREGTILFKKNDGTVLGKAEVKVFAPAPPPVVSRVNRKPPPRENPKNSAGISPEKLQQLQTLANILHQQLREYVADEALQLQLKDGQCTITIAGPVIFDLGQTHPKPQAVEIINVIGGVLKGNLPSGFSILIKGHADDLPIKEAYREKIPSNWELSATRAASVARYLQENLGVQGTQITSAGYSYFQQITMGETLEEKALNRRLEIVIQPENGELP